MSGPTVSTTVTNDTVDAAGTMNLQFNATYTEVDGSTHINTITQALPANQVAMFLAMIKQVVSPAQYVVPNSAAPTNQDVARLAAECIAIFQAAPGPAAAPAQAAVPPPFTLAS